ncbi:MAG: hypothetical protein ABH829_03255 [archaeon]
MRYLSLLLLFFFVPAAAAFHVTYDSVSLCRYSTNFVDVVFGDSGSGTASYTLQKSGDAADWVTLSESSFSVQEGTLKTVKAFFTIPPDAAFGAHSVVISDGTEEKTITVNVMNCYAIELTPAKESVSVCPFEEYLLPLEVRNTGKYSELISLNAETKIDPFAITVLPQSTSTAYAVITGVENPTTYNLSITAKSQETGASDSAEVRVTVEDCYGAEVSAPLAEVCQGERAHFSFSITNTGTRANEFLLSAPAGLTLSANKAYVKPGQTERISYYLSPGSSDAGKYSLDVVFSAGKWKKTVAFPVNVRDCTDFSVSAGNFQLCPGKSHTLKARVSNLSPYEYGYKTSLYDSRTGSTKYYNYILPAEGYSDIEYQIDTAATQPAGEHTVTFETGNGHKVLKNTARYSTLPFDACYNVDAKADRESYSVEKGKGEMIQLKITNTGAENSQYELQAYPEFVTIEPSILPVAAGASKEVQLYASPEMGTEPGQYDITVAVTTDKISKYYDIPLQVTEAGESAAPSGFVILSADSSRGSSEIGYALTALGIGITGILLYLMVERR